MITRILLTLSFLFFAVPAQAFDACNAADTQKYVPLAQRYSHGLLFEIIACGKPASYVFGTIHSDDPQLRPVIGQAFDALEISSQAAFEYEEKPENGSYIGQVMFYPPGSLDSLDKHLTPDEFTALTKILGERARIEPRMAAKLEPWAAALMLQYPRTVNDGVVLDMRLQQAAREQNKPIIGLESVEEQLGIFRDIPTEQQILMLKDAIATINDINAMNDKMMDLYVHQDVTGLQALGDESFAKIEDAGLREHLTKRLILNRNRVMASRLKPYLEQGGIFVAVGTLHLPGEEGVLRLLEKNGYFVFPVR